jgi:acyl-CoA reductase-like NAD-dependent aldehyde dehydrogenase
MRRSPTDKPQKAIDRRRAHGVGEASREWTAILNQGKALSLKLQAGHTAITAMTSSDPRLPFGGVKHSGYGRELATQGIHEFVNAHTVVVNPPEGPGGVASAIE